jgi:hypothetical protein
MKTVWGGFVQTCEAAGQAGARRPRASHHGPRLDKDGRLTKLCSTAPLSTRLSTCVPANTRARAPSTRPDVDCRTVCWHWAWAKSHTHPPESILVSPRCCVFALILGTVWVPSPTARICHVPASVDAPSREDLRHGRFLFWPSALKRNLWALTARKEMDLRAPRGLSQRPWPARRGASSQIIVTSCQRLHQLQNHGNRKPRLSASRARDRHISQRLPCLEVPRCLS